MDFSMLFLEIAFVHQFILHQKKIWSPLAFLFQQYPTFINHIDSHSLSQRSIFWEWHASGLSSAWTDGDVASVKIALIWAKSFSSNESCRKDARRFAILWALKDGVLADWVSSTAFVFSLGLDKAHSSCKSHSHSSINNHHEIAKWVRHLQWLFDHLNNF